MRIASEIPGPRSKGWGIPLLRQLQRDYLGTSIAWARQFGDLSTHRVLWEQVVDLSHPELLRQVLVEQADRLVRWERAPQVFSQVMGQSVLVTEGATWQRQRRMLQAGFTPKRVAGYGELMVQAATAALANTPPGVTDVDGLFTRLTMDVILRTLFSAGAPASSAEAAAAVKHLGENGMREMFMLFTLPDWLPLPGKAAKRHAKRVLFDLVRGHISRRRSDANPPADDLLAMLLALRDEDGTGLTEQEMLDQCMVTFLAGHDTSASSLIWWSWCMASHPRAQQQALDEVDAVLAGRAPTAADVSALPWITATFKESMRLYPPIAGLMTRRATAPLTVGEYQIPAGAMVRLTPWVLHRDARWFPEPEAFRPERWMPQAEPPPRGAYLPFGLGPRVCLGQHFAMLELQLTGALLLQRFRMDLAGNGQAPRPVPKLSVTLRPAEPLSLMFSPR